MIDALAVAHFSSALLALLVTGLMTTGFVRLAWHSTGLVRHLATGILTIHAAVFLRTLYRDIFPLVFDDGSLLFTRSGVLTVTFLLNLLIIVSGWHGLRALHVAIPERVRNRYSLLTAAMYPPLRRR